MKHKIERPVSGTRHRLAQWNRLSLLATGFEVL
jgi:hypothetical protein